MFAAAFAVGAPHIRELERVVRAVLGELDIEIIGDATVLGLDARYELATSEAALARAGAATEAPSVALYAASGELDPIFAVDVRGPRSPLWHLCLAQGLSCELGAWAAALVNDRLRDDYGYGFFLAGHPVEGDVGKTIDEDANWARFKTLLAHVGGDLTVSAAMLKSLPTTSVVRVLFLGLDNRADEVPPVLRRPDGMTRTIGTLTAFAPDEHEGIERMLQSIGLTVTTFNTQPSYYVLPDGSLDEATRPVLCFGGRAPVRSADVLDVLARVTSRAAIVELGARPGEIQAWTRAGGARFVRLEGDGVDVLARAWEPIEEWTSLRPMVWRFPS